MCAPAAKREREEMVATDSSDTNKEKKGVEKKKNGMREGWKRMS